MFRSTDTIYDARWGIGVYFIDMDPDNFQDEQIAYSNWVHTLSDTIKSKLDLCIKVKFPTSEIQDCCEGGRRIFLYPGWDVNLTSYPHRVIQINL